MTSTENDELGTNDNSGEQKSSGDLSKVFKCNSCSKTFAAKYNLQRHNKYVHMKHQDERSYKCELCDRKFSEYRSLENHINSHLGLKPYKCEICSRRFTFEIALKRHNDSIHPKEPKIRKWNCSKCEKRCFTRSDLKIHFESAHEGIRYFCETCGASFTRKMGLKYHQLIHKGELPFGCKKCPKRFHGTSSLTKHFMRLHVDKSAKKHKCSFCSKTFFELSNLKTHLVVHTNDSRHSCVLCSKAFGNRWNLENHMRSHTLERPFKCLQCPKAFRRQSYLKEHQSCKHNIGGNGFPCVFCNLKCGNKSRLQDHYMRHVQEKPYPCRRCDKSFASKGEMKSHFNKHMAENAPN